MTVALYVRVSTPRQAHTQTLEQQLERLRARVEACHPECLVFRDDGYSGATLRRPAPPCAALRRPAPPCAALGSTRCVTPSRDAVASAGVERVLMTAPDRLARKYVHQALLLEELERFGCVVEFLDRPLSQDPHDQLLLQIRGAVAAYERTFAAYERTLMAERMRRGRLANLRTGTLLPWTRVPWTRVP
jgi:site-specific DNA recombinase